jgi:alanyl-tRNA synthetase
VAGNQALGYFRQYHEIVTELSRQLSTSPNELAEIVQLQSSQLQAAQKEIEGLQADLLSFEAEKLVTLAEPVPAGLLVIRLYENRSPAELRELAKLLQNEGKLVALLAGFDGQKLALVVSCGDETGVSARELLDNHLAQIGGRGGGNARLAQGGGGATPGQVERFFANTRQYI